MVFLKRFKNFKSFGAILKIMRFSFLKHNSNNNQNFKKELQQWYQKGPKA